MAKNRKNQASEIRFGPVLKVVLLCALICGAAIGYVWQKSQLDRLGRQISEREIRLRQLQSDNKQLADQIALLHSPVMLDRRSRELNLGLGPAQPYQVVRLVDLPSPPVSGGPRQFAQRPAVGTP
jgi:cell division protein FtsB